MSALYPELTTRAQMQTLLEGSKPVMVACEPPTPTNRRRNFTKLTLVS